MTSRIRQIAPLVAVAAAAIVAGCGDSGEPDGRKLPRTVSDALTQQLDSISGRVANGSAGACDDIYLSGPEGGNVEPIDTALRSVPSDVDGEIRSALEQSVERLKQLVDEECSDIRAAEQDEQGAVPDETVETTPTETETTPTETDTVTTETETAPAPPVDDGGDGDADGNGEGNGAPDGRGPDGLGPPGQQGGAEAPGDEGGD